MSNQSPPEIVELRVALPLGFPAGQALELLDHAIFVTEDNGQFDEDNDMALAIEFVELLRSKL